MNMILKNTLRLLFCSFFIPLCPLLQAWDFGLNLNQNAGVSGYDSDSGFRYSASVVPRVSGLIGDNGDYYVSAGVEAAYQEEQWSFITELLRTEFTFRFSALEIKAGRMYHSDPLGLITRGLFDGARVSYCCIKEK